MGGANIKSLQESSYPIPNWCATAIVFNAVRQFCFPKPNSARLGRYDTICSVVRPRHFRLGSKTPVLGDGAARQFYPRKQKCGL